MKYFILTVFFIIVKPTFSQTITEIDSVSYLMCIELEKTQDEKNDTLRYNQFIETHINKYMSSIDLEEMDRVGQILFFRLQRNCLDFMEVLDHLDPSKVDQVKRMLVQPESVISKKDIAKFKKTKDFYYYEVNGDLTRVKMSNVSWQDSFVDGTTSNLSCSWISSTDFLLTFVESDNQLRKNFSIAGDEFHYTLISKEKDHFLLTVKIPEHSKYEEVKLYFK